VFLGHLPAVPWPSLTLPLKASDDAMLLCRAVPPTAIFENFSRPVVDVPFNFSTDEGSEALKQVTVL